MATANAARTSRGTVMFLIQRISSLAPTHPSALASRGFKRSLRHSREDGYMRILVVDDEPQLRRALERALKLEGYEVALAADGEEALGSVGSGGPLDAIVLDV